MKNFLIIVLALVVGGVGGYFAYKKLYQKESSANEGSTNKRVVTAENYQEPFMWGIHLNPSSFQNYSLEFWNKQLKYATKLATPWIRLPMDQQALSHLNIYDEMIQAAKDRGMSIYLLLHPSGPYETLSDPYADGAKVGGTVAARYKGRVKYYQLLSEGGNYSIKGPEFPGDKEEQYDEKRYGIIRDWLRGASEAIKQADPEAYIVINDLWIHTAYIEKLAKDNIGYDILGWNWFSDMGNIWERKIDNGLFIDQLKKFNKPIFLTEVNYRPDVKKKTMDEDKQSEFIGQTAEWAHKSGFIKGFIVFELVDRPLEDNKGIDYNGLIKLKESSTGTYTFGDTRKAFDTYKDIIVKYSQ